MRAARANGLRAAMHGCQAAESWGRIVGLQGSRCLQGERVGRCGASEHRVTGAVDDLAAEGGDRLVVADGGHLDAGDQGLANADRLEEPPLDGEEDGARAGQVFGDDGVEQAGGDAALDDELAKAARLGERAS